MTNLTKKTAWHKALDYDELLEDSVKHVVCRHTHIYDYGNMILNYPQSSKTTLDMRPALHPLFKQLPEGISEFTFANLYLFRETHHYRISYLVDKIIMVFGDDAGETFFMLPFGLPDKDMMDELFGQFVSMKCVSENQTKKLTQMGYAVSEDRQNFDYLYLQKDLAELSGRKFHKKRNLIKAFINNYSYEGKPLLEEYHSDAIHILETWRQGRSDIGDYIAAKEALEKAEELQLCGGIYYVDGQPCAYSLGEELAQGQSFVIHFEKAVKDYKGLWQFVNQAFASILPEIYKTINREQDLGTEGLRKAKLSYNPVDFVKKYRVKN